MYDHAVSLGAAPGAVKPFGGFQKVLQTPEFYFLDFINSYGTYYRLMFRFGRCLQEIRVLDIPARCQAGSSFGCNNYLKAKDIEMVKGLTTKLLSLVFLGAGVAVAQGIPPDVTLDLSKSRPVHPAAQSPAQSAPPRKDIPAIARAANGAIVSIVMSDKDGKPIAQGSGFLVSKDGLVLTNYHVIAEGSSAIVKLPDGAFYVVDGVVASDKARDVAVIKTHGTNFRTLTLGNSDGLQVGQEVVAIGNPLSLESTVSNGIVSGIRTIKEGKFLQITAPISHGSSGGPLFNMVGEVVGITAAIIESGENLNFAIPINEAKRLLLNKSTSLHSLPNEAPPVGTQHPEEGQPATMAQQKACAEQAERKFNERNQYVNWVDGYTSHFNTAVGVCFVEMSNSRKSTDTKNLVWIFRHDITDAFGGRVYGTFMEVTRTGDAQLLSRPCFIYLPGQDSIVCESEETFDNLAFKYFGITPY
jgi:V8-like Glu-specific endopeptidase